MGLKEVVCSIPEMPEIISITKITLDPGEETKVAVEDGQFVMVWVRDGSVLVNNWRLGIGNPLSLRRGQECMGRNEKGLFTIKGDLEKSQEIFVLRSK